MVAPWKSVEVVKRKVLGDPGLRAVFGTAGGSLMFYKYI